MSFELDLTQGARALPPSPGRIIARIGPCSVGAVGRVDEWDRGQDTQVETILGEGELVDWTAKSLVGNGQRCVTVVAAASIAGGIGNLQKTGAGGTVVATGTPTAHFEKIVVAITTPGPLGVARGKSSLDGGSTWGDEFDLPAELPGTQRGTGDLTTITLASLNGEHFIFTPDAGAAVDVVFSSVTSPGDVVAQVATALGVHGTARLIGGKYLEISGVMLNTGTLAVAAGNANALLGFASNFSVPGTGSNYAIPKTGIMASFHAGAYALATTYAFPAYPARMSVADFQAALAALRASGVRFSVVLPTQVPLDGEDGGGAELRSFAVALHTFLASVRQSLSDRIYPIGVLGSPLGDTGQSGVDANDVDVKAALAGFVEDLVTIVHGDIFADGVTLNGTFRRSAAQMAGDQMAARRLSMNVGFGAVPPGYAMQSADGAVSCRDENFATTKMGGYGFTVVARQDGQPKFGSGTTRSAPGGKLVFLNLTRVGWEAMRVVYARLKTFDLKDLHLNDNGTLRESDARAFEKVFDADLKSALVDEDHASGARTQIDRSIVVQQDGTYPMRVTFSVQVKGQLTNVRGTVALVATANELS